MIVYAMADDERRASIPSTAATAWGGASHVYPHSHHGTPAQEYAGFSFSMPQVTMDPSPIRSNIQQRPMPPPLQPLIMPQWPSMLSSQSHTTTYQPIYSQSVQHIQPLSIGSLQTPVVAASTRPVSTPRKTLTDADRKRMCQYAEEHPNSKQTEIGAIFGVERSTVSKVLRQKEKYLLQDDGRRSPVKRAKGRSPDIERALAVWAKNQERKGIPLTDDLIREKARAFATTSPSPDNHYTQSASWIEKFKLKNNLMGARSRKGSLAPDDAEEISASASSSHTPGCSSPVSPRNLGLPSPKELHSAQSEEILKAESPDSIFDFGGRHGPFHSQSTNSLHSAFTDTAPSSFSPPALSPTSPFFTPDSGTAPSPFIPPLTARPILMAPTHFQRPRSLTFPSLDQSMSGVCSTDPPTPKYITANVLDSPMEEVSNPILSIDEVVRQSEAELRRSTVTPSETMRPPPLPAHILETKRDITPSTSTSSAHASTSPEEARKALEVVMAFIEQQPSGFLDFHESVHMGRLMEKLKLHSQVDGGL